MKKSQSLIKLIALLLVFSMILSGCSGASNNDTKAPESDGKTTEAKENNDDSGEVDTPKEAEEVTPDPVTFSVYMDRSLPDYPKEGTIVGNEIKRITGVDFDYEFLVGADGETRLSVMIASGDYPDLFNCYGGMTRLYEAGALMPLDDYIDDYPNLKRIVDKYGNTMRQDDGLIYNIPAATRLYAEVESSDWTANGLQMNTAVLKEFGYPDVTTLEQYFDLIAQYKEKYPEYQGQETIGFVALFDSWMSFTTKMLPVFQQGYMNDRHLIGVEEVDGKWTVVNPHVKDGAKKVYQVMNKAYNDGIIHPETFIMKKDQVDSLIASGAVLGHTLPAWLNAGPAAALLSDGKGDRLSVALPIVIEEGIEEHYMENTPYHKGIGGGLAISTQCEDIERALEFMDWSYSDEAIILKGWGIEGVHYEVNDDGSFKTIGELSENLQDSDWFNYDFGFEYAAFATGAGGAVPNGVNSTAAMYDKAAQYEVHAVGGIKEYLEAKDAKTIVEAAPFNLPLADSVAWNPLYSEKAASGSDYDIAMGKMDDVLMKYVPRLIVAKDGEFEEVWADYVAEMAEVDVAKVIEFYQMTLDKRLRINKALLQ